METSILLRAIRTWWTRAKAARGGPSEGRGLPHHRHAEGRAVLHDQRIRPAFRERRDRHARVCDRGEGRRVSWKPRRRASCDSSTSSPSGISRPGDGNAHEPPLDRCRTHFRRHSDQLRRSRQSRHRRRLDHARFRVCLQRDGYAACRPSSGPTPRFSFRPALWWTGSASGRCTQPRSLCGRCFGRDRG